MQDVGDAINFTASHPLSPTLSSIVNKGITVIFGGTEELLEVQEKLPQNLFQPPQPYLKMFLIFCLLGRKRVKSNSLRKIYA